MNRYKVMLFISIFISFPILNPIYSEVEEVTVNWNRALCNANCSDLIGKKLEELKEAEKVSINAQRGTAYLKWNPKERFSYFAIKRKMQEVGTGITNIRVRVRGIAKKEGKNIYLYSLGDNTRFQLVSPHQENPGQAAVLPNPAFMKLSPDLSSKILEEAKLGKIIVIEGPLYAPWKSPALMIIVQRMQTEKKKTPVETAKQPG